MKIPFEVSFYGFNINEDDTCKLCLNTTIDIDERIVFSSSFHSLDALALQLLIDYDKELSYYNIETVWFDCALDSVLYSEGICVTWNIDKQEYEVL